MDLNINKVENVDSLIIVIVGVFMVSCLIWSCWISWGVARICFGQEPDVDALHQPS